MLTMDQIHDIRRRYYEKGGNISQIASSLQIDWRTVRKYIDMKDFNEPVAKPAYFGHIRTLFSKTSGQ